MLSFIFILIKVINITFGVHNYNNNRLYTVKLKLYMAFLNVFNSNNNYAPRPIIKYNKYDEVEQKKVQFKYKRGMRTNCVVLISCCGFIYGLELYTILNTNDTLSSFVFFFYTRIRRKY